jgi:antitoxin HicB
MPQYVALLQEEADGCHTVSFPDIPGLMTAGDTFDEAMEEAEEALEFAAEDWTNPDGSTGLPTPRTVDQLGNDPAFVTASKGAIVVLIDYPSDENTTE